MTSVVDCEQNNKVQDAANSNRPSTQNVVVDGVEADSTTTTTTSKNNNNTTTTTMLKQLQAAQQQEQANAQDDDEQQEESKSASKSANNKNKSNNKSSSLNLNPANTLVNGCTPLEEQFQDAVALIQGDVERAARVANVYRHYDAVEMP